MDGLPIVSLQTSEAVALNRAPIIDMETFGVVAFRCDSSSGHGTLVLMTRDIRQLAADCIIVDSEDELAKPEDIVRLQSTLKADYSPLDKTVVSDLGRKLGVVEDFAINSDNGTVQKLFVRASILRSLFGSNLTIDRSQIIDISPKKITVREATIKSPVLQAEPVPDAPS